MKQKDYYLLVIKITAICLVFFAPFGHCLDPSEPTDSVNKNELADKEKGLKKDVRKFQVIKKSGNYGYNQVQDFKGWRQPWEEDGNLKRDSERFAGTVEEEPHGFKRFIENPEKYDSTHVDSKRFLVIEEDGNGHLDSKRFIKLSEIDDKPNEDSEKFSDTEDDLHRNSKRFLESSETDDNLPEDSKRFSEVEGESGNLRHDSKRFLQSPEEDYQYDNDKESTRSVQDRRIDGPKRFPEINNVNNEIDEGFKRSQKEFDTPEAHPTHSTLERPKRTLNPAVDKKEQLEKVTIEVERLFDSLNKRRSEIEDTNKNRDNENEITVVIENDDEDDHDDKISSKKSDIPGENGSGFSIILDNTNGNEDLSVPKSTADDFSKMSRSYEQMNARFQTFLSEEKNRITRVNPAVSSQSHRSEESSKQYRATIPTPSKPTRKSSTAPRNTIEANIEKLKKLRERLQKESAAIDSEADASVKEIRSKMIENRTTSSPSNLESDKVDMTRATRREKIFEAESKSRTGVKGNLTKQKISNRDKGERKSGFDSSETEQRSRGTESSIKSRTQPTNKRFSSTHEITLRTGRRYYPTHTINAATKAASRAASNHTSEGTKRPGSRVIFPRKASAMIEYLNKDPLESWFYKFQSLAALGLNSTMLRNGLVNAGSIDRLKNVMVRALKGDDITLSVVGGSISAGGGLYKDEGNIGGLYYKGVVDWWNKVITPLTGSEMKVNNIAIGSIGTDYFSYCLRSHISNESDIIIWELSGNDYNRYLKTPTKGAKPLERLTRMALQIPSDPAILFVNFFKGVDYKKTRKNCPNFEDQGEDIIAHYYKIPSLSWRAMVCESLIEQSPMFTLKTLFCKDQYHPSLLAHAQTALLLILHLRHVMRSVLQYASSHDGFLPNFASFYTLPAPLFVGLEHPVPLCWTLISPDFKESLTNNLEVKILSQNGFKIEYATNFPIRFDRVICWKAEKVGAVMKTQITLPEEAQRKNGPVDERIKDMKFEIAITTHTRFGGSAEVWLDQRSGQPIVIQEGRPNDTGKRTQVDVITQNAEPGVHTLNFKVITSGFCLASIMVS